MEAVLLKLLPGHSTSHNTDELCYVNNAIIIHWDWDKYIKVGQTLSVVYAVGEDAVRPKYVYAQMLLGYKSLA